MRQIFIPDKSPREYGLGTENWTAVVVFNWLVQLP